MIDLEQRLRDDFSTAAGAWDAEISADDVLAAGRTARRGRTMRRLVVAAVAAVALTSVSIVAAPPIIAQVLNQRTVTGSGSYRWGEVGSEFDDVAVQLTREHGVTTAVITGSRAGKQTASVTQVLPDPLTAPVRLRLGKRAVVAMLPGKATEAELVLWNSGGSGGQLHWLDTFNLSVVVAQTAKTVPGLDTLDWVWADETGAVHSIDGTPAARLTLGTETMVVYCSRSQHQVGVVDRFAFPVGDTTAADLLDGGLAIGDTMYQLGAFPPGTHDVQLTLDDPKGEWVGAVLSDGSVVVIAKVPADADKVVRKVSYRTADGQLVTRGH